MTGINIYSDTLLNMENTVRLISEHVNSPVRVKFKDSFVYRYSEQTVYQALILKSARLVSGLRASQLLSDNGFVQEQACLQRVMDEIIEDIFFLAYPKLGGTEEKIHENYLAYFWQEEFEDTDKSVSSLERPMVARKKIRAYLERCLNGNSVSSKNLDAMRTVSKAYSGYIHAASPQIMDMYMGEQAQFMMRGMVDTERQAEHIADLWNYYYRGIGAFCIIAKAFGNESLFDSIRKFEKKFLEITGHDFYSSKWDLLDIK